MFYVANGNAYVRADDGTIYPVDVTVKERVTERRDIESYKVTPKEEPVDQLPPGAASATIEELLGKFVITEDKPLNFDQSKHDEAVSGKPQPKGEARVTIQTSGNFLGVDYSTLGTFAVDGLSITGQANKKTAVGWNGEGQDKEGYFVALHFENAKKFSTANKPDGKTLDESGNLLLLLGEGSPTLAYIDVTDNKDVTDRYTVSITAADAIKAEAPKQVAKAPARKRAAKASK